MGFVFALFMILLSYSSFSSSSSSITKLAISECFESIVSFGDSLADTGNDLVLYQEPPTSAYPPFGQTFFHHPTGRFSDGRLVIDFIAESLGLPLVQPYFGGERAEGFINGVNFAVAGSTTLDYEFYDRIGVGGTTNVSLSTQLHWFKHFLATIPDDKKFVKKSLVLMQETGGNDYNHPIMHGTSREVIQSVIVPMVINYVRFTIEELIKVGVETLLIPGSLPIGCVPAYLTQFKTSSIANDYDPTTGCLNWLNKLAMHHNQLLQRELNRIRHRFPHVSLIYADYYNNMMRIYVSPNEFGFSKENVTRACCGSGGSYNYNVGAKCGTPTATCCGDISSFVSWDGLHFTEAANRLIALGFVHGPYTIPPMTTLPCINQINIS